MRRILRRVEAGGNTAAFDDRVDALRVERRDADLTPFVDAPETPAHRSIFENSSQACKASTGRPTMSALSPASAEEVLVRRSRTARTGSVGPRARRRIRRNRSAFLEIVDPQPDDFGTAPPAGAEGKQNRARSRRSIALPRPQVANRESRMSRVIAPALLRAGGRSAARIERRKALRMAGLPNGPSTPRQRCSVAHNASRRRTVAGACGPEERRRPSARKASATDSGMP